MWRTWELNGTFSCCVGMTGYHGDRWLKKVMVRKRTCYHFSLAEKETPRRAGIVGEVGGGWLLCVTLRATSTLAFVLVASLQPTLHSLSLQTCGLVHDTR